MPDQAAWVAFGRLGRAHGLKGEVRFFAHNPDSERLYDLASVELRLDGRVLATRVLALRPGAGALLLQLEHVRTREDAEAWTNAELFVPADLFDALEGDEFYAFELEGMSAVSADGTVVGTVIGLENYGAGDLLAVRIRNRDLLLPFAEPWVGAVDREARTVVVAPGEFLEP
jgi:16S rRNA processing protein RimM